MPNNDFGFDFEKTVYNDLLNRNITPITKVIIEAFGTLNNIKYTGDNYHLSADIVYNNKLLEIKDVSSGKGTYANLSLNKCCKLLNLPLFDFNKYYSFFKKNNIEFNNKNVSPLSKEMAEDICFIKNYNELCKLDNNERNNYINKLYNYFLNNKNALINFINYCIFKTQINKEIVDLYLVYNSKLKEITYLYFKEDIYKMSNNYSNILLTNKGINFGSFRISISWKNHIGNNLAIYVFLN
jgi:hypothetical protein